jgi:formylglycine-generating enzyme required for sulfatase activity
MVLLLAPPSLAAQEVTLMLTGDVPLTLVKVPAGTFLMGSPEGERGNFLSNETLHEVTLTEDYYMGKTEITQAQWQAVMGTPMPDDCGDSAVGDDFPVYCVTWNMIAGPGGFMEKLNQQLGTSVFRLPTEAEWERAARAGTTTRFAHGDVLECSDECEPCAAHDPHMNWCGNVSPFQPVEVGQKLANPFGLHDMHGNLWEFVNDRYAADLGSSPVTDPTGPGGSGDIVMRGGGFEAWINRSASRIGGAPDDRNKTDQMGFRLAATTLDGLAFQINNGISDAWYWPLTAGQGFFIIVWPELQSVFLSWFTFDTERPAEDVTAILGEPGHRWLTALGPYSGDTATLDVYLTQGGVFDSPEPKPETDPEPIGTMELQFSGCNEGMVSYDIPSLELTGSVPIERITQDNVPLCESQQ